MTISSVAVPVSTFFFREDDDSRGFNLGTWELNWQLNTPTPAPYPHPQSFTWVDPIPMYHGNVSTASFVDGHAESYTWGDSAIINYGKFIAAGGSTVFNPPNPPNITADYEYVYQGYRFPGRAAINLNEQKRDLCKRSVCGFRRPAGDTPRPMVVVEQGASRHCGFLSPAISNRILAVPTTCRRRPTRIAGSGSQYPQVSPQLPFVKWRFFFAKWSGIFPGGMYVLLK